MRIAADNHGALALGRVRQGVAHEVDAAALPGGIEHLGGRRLEPLMRVRDDELDAGEAAALQLMQERGPEGLRLRSADLRPSTSRRPSVLTAVAIITATETTRPSTRVFT